MVKHTQTIRRRFAEAKVEHINKILRNVNSKKATGPDKIPPKIVKMLADIIDSHLTKVINSNLKRNAFSDLAKVASICPVFKRKG